MVAQLTVFNKPFTPRKWLVTLSSVIYSRDLIFPISISSKIHTNFFSLGPNEQLFTSDQMLG